MSKLFVLTLLAMLWSSSALADTEDQAQVAIAQAATAVEAAENADAATAASAVMRAARDHLTAARGAWQRESWEAALMAAQKAKVDANLAGARARQKRATDATAEIEASVETLRRQINMPEA